VWHSALSRTTTMPLTPESSSSLAHLEELQRVQLFPHYFLPSCAGHAQHTASEHTATSDVGCAFSTYNHSAQWLEFKATMSERIEVRNSIECLCLALQGEVSHPFDSDSPPCSRPATTPIFLRHQVAVQSLLTHAAAQSATGASKPRSAMSEGGYYNAMAKAINARHDSSRTSKSIFCLDIQAQRAWLEEVEAVPQLKRPTMFTVNI